MRLIQFSRTAKLVAARLFPLRNWRPLLQCARQRARSRKAVDDGQLQIYSQILPGGFLNYGYSDDTTQPPERLSLESIQQAQVRYGERLLDHLRTGDSRVLDAGCGMGGLLGLLLRRGFVPTALTPNRTQIQHVRSEYPAVPLIESKLEDISHADYRGYFNAAITSESFQYMDLPRAIDAIDAILRPDGRWILCDCFRRHPGRRKPGHAWTDFTAALDRQGWRIVHSQDITQNVLPTIAYVHMWGQRLGAPLTTYLVNRLRRKRPVIHYLLQDVLEGVRTTLLQQLDAVDPAVFVREKRYMLLVLERRSSPPGSTVTIS